LLSAQELRNGYCDDRDAAGAMREHEGVGIQPVEFTFGLMAKVRALGARIHHGRPV